MSPVMNSVVWDRQNRQRDTAVFREAGNARPGNICDEESHAHDPYPRYKSNRTMYSRKRPLVRSSAKVLENMAVGDRRLLSYQVRSDEMK
jgi:hypothetical protein